MNPSQTMTICAGLFALIAASSGDDEKSVPAPQGKELRVIHVQDLIRPTQRDPLPQLGHVLAASMDDDELTDLEGVLSTGVRRIDLDQLIELIVSSDSAKWEAEGASIQGQGGRLLIVNDSAVIDAARDVVKRMRAALAPRIRVSYVLFRDGQSDAGFRTLSADAASDLAARMRTAGKVLGDATASCRAGDTVWLGQHETVGFQADLNVEVAQEAKIADPVTRKIRLSRGVACTPVVRPGGGLALFCAFAWSDLARLEAIDIVAPPTNQIETAEVKQAQTVFSLGIGQSGGFVLAPGGHVWPDLRLLVVAERLDQAPARVAGDALIPCGIASSAMLTEWGNPKDGGLVIKDRISLDAILETARTVSRIGDNEGDAATATNSFLLFRSEAERVSSALRVSEFVMRSSDRSFVVEVAREARGAGESWTRLGAPLQVPCMGGRLGYASQGFEQNYLGEFDVEIAQKASVADPVVDTCFDGADLVASVEPLDGSCLVQVILDDSAVEELRRIAAPAENIGALWQPKISKARVRRAVTIAPGSSVSLCQGPARVVGGKRVETRLSLRLSEIK